MLAPRPAPRRADLQGAHLPVAHGQHPLGLGALSRRYRRRIGTSAAYRSAPSPRLAVIGTSGRILDS
jgi:hypothetical protein